MFLKCLTGFNYLEPRKKKYLTRKRFFFKYPYDLYGISGLAKKKSLVCGPCKPYFKLKWAVTKYKNKSKNRFEPHCTSY